VIGASGLSDDDDGKNDGLKLKLTESGRRRNDIFYRYSAIVILKILNKVFLKQFQYYVRPAASRVDRRIRIRTDNGSG